MPKTAPTLAQNCPYFYIQIQFYVFQKPPPSSIRYIVVMSLGDVHRVHIVNMVEIAPSTLHGSFKCDDLSVCVRIV
jgi:hypothetical protein